jgi:hypothetical protein
MRSAHVSQHLMFLRIFLKSLMLSAHVLMFLRVLRVLVLQCVSQHLMFLTSLCSFKSLKSLTSLKSFSDEPYVSKFCVCKHLAHCCRPSLLAMMAFSKACFKNKLKDKDDKNDDEKGEDLVSLIQHHGCL